MILNRHIDDVEDRLANVRCPLTVNVKKINGSVSLSAKLNFLMTEARSWNIGVSWISKHTHQVSGHHGESCGGIPSRS